MNGLQAAAQIKGLAHVVFITAYNQYAVEAFERGAIDYVLKPASEARLAETVARLKERVAQPAPSAEALQAALAQVAAALGKPEAHRLRWIQASIGNQVRLVPVADVLFFQSDLKYTRVVTASGESLIRKPLKDLIAELDPAQFWQISPRHRGQLAVDQPRGARGRAHVAAAQGGERAPRGQPQLHALVPQHVAARHWAPPRRRSCRSGRCPIPDDTLRAIAAAADRP